MARRSLYLIHHKAPKRTASEALLQAQPRPRTKVRRLRAQRFLWALTIILPSLQLVTIQAASGQDSHRDIRGQRGVPKGLEQVLKNGLGGLNPKQTKALLESLQKSQAGKHNKVPDLNKMDPKNREAFKKLIDQMMPGFDPKNWPKQPDGQGKPQHDPDGQPGGPPVGEPDGQPDSPTDPRSKPRGRPDLQDPEVREQWRQVFEKFQKLDQAENPNQQNEIMKFLSENDDLVKGFVDLMKKHSGDPNAGPNADGSSNNPFPWLKDPDFPKELLNSQQHKGVFDELFKDAIKSQQVDSWLRKGLRWRNQNERNSTRRQRQRRQRQARRNGAQHTPNNPSSTNNPAGPRRRLLPRARNQSSWLSSWRMPRLRRFSGFSGLRLNFQPGRWSFGSPSGPSAPPVSGQGLASAFVLVFLLFALAIAWNTGFTRPLAQWISQTVQGKPRARWPVAPLAMRSNADFVANVLHLNRVVEPSRVFNHKQLEDALKAMDPVERARVEELCVLFEREYYRSGSEPLSPEQLKSFGRMLDHLSRLPVQRSAPSGP